MARPDREPLGSQLTGGACIRTLVPMTPNPKDEETPEQRLARLERFLEDEVWPRVPADLLGRGPSKQEREKVLGYGPGTA